MRIKRIITHWSDSGPFTTVAEIDRWHKARGFKGIGYHRVIVHPKSLAILHTPEQLGLTWDKVVKQGRNLDMDVRLEPNEVGAHTLGFNRDSVAICVVSGPNSPLHPLQRKALIQTNLVLMARFGLTRKDLYCHRDLNATQCPGNEIAGVIQGLRRSA
jgi:N-acetylmuramoyl-L-alanine amidase